MTIIEARHLGEPSGNPYVSVRLGNRKRKTAVRKRTDNPYYNEVRGSKLFFPFEVKGLVIACVYATLANIKAREREEGLRGGAAGVSRISLAEDGLCANSGLEVLGFLLLEWRLSSVRFV